MQYICGFVPKSCISLFDLPISSRDTPAFLCGRHRHRPVNVLRHVGPKIAALALRQEIAKKLQIPCKRAAIKPRHKRANGEDAVKWKRRICGWDRTAGVGGILGFTLRHHHWGGHFARRLSPKPGMTVLYSHL